MHKRASNILQDLGQIRSQNEFNCRQHLEDKKWTQPLPSDLPSPGTLSKKMSAPIYSAGLTGSLADDFHNMLSRLDHLSKTQRIK